MPKKAFSGKAKKAQLQAKKQRQQGKKNLGILKKGGDYTKDNEAFTGGSDLPSRRDGRSRYELQFKKETAEDLKASKERAMLPLQEGQDVTAYTEQYFDSYHDFPKRPAWNPNWSKEKLEANEQRVFRQYVTRLLKTDNDIPRPVRRRSTDSEDDEEEEDYYSGDHEDHSEDVDQRKDSLEAPKELSYFELNLETWRQLWRVLEKSDVLLLILDVRYAAATFPPSLYEYILSKGKHLILVLNKIDLIPAGLAAAWKNYFLSTYPSIHIVFFTSFPSYNLVGVKENRRGMKIRKKKTVFSIVKEASQQIWEICNKLVGEKVDLESWKSKIEGTSDVETRIVHEAYDHTKDSEGKESTLTIGTLGHPNVGKSSLINSLCGKKVVSVSRTPGHTKHFQTIFLTKTVKLCDCPGLVFPSKVPKPLQVLMGSFPIAQLREPFSVVQFLAERLNIPHLLDLHLPEDEKAWSAFAICESWAIKKGFLTARTSRPDSYRAANMILRFALDGRICLTFVPPEYKESEWTNHPDAQLAEEIIAKKRSVEYKDVEGGDGDNSDNDGDDTQEDDFDDDDDVHSGDGNKSDDEGENDEYDSGEDSDEGTAVSSNPFALLADS